MSPPQTIDYCAMLGEKFGRLTVLGPALDKPGDLDHRPRVTCLCDCGSEIETQARHVLSGHTNSCGCLKRKEALSHGHCKHGAMSRTYRAWSDMRTRCRNPKNEEFKNYGGRGIIVCERWAVFENFLTDMDEVPPGLTIERTDNNGNYQPGNCRWASNQEQQNNKRNNRRIEFRGEVFTIAQWAKRLGLPDSSLRKRLGRGWSVERALTTRSLNN
jgi:hypothetical protein